MWLDLNSLGLTLTKHLLTFLPYFVRAELGSNLFRMWCQGFAICLLVAVSVLAMSVSSQTEEAIECEDFGEFCKKIGPSVCTEYRDFSMVYCRVFCGFCNDARPTDGWTGFSFPPGFTLDLGLSSLAPDVTSAAFDSSTDDVGILHSSTISGSTTYEGGESSGVVTGVTGNPHIPSTLPGHGGVSSHHSDRTDYRWDTTYSTTEQWIDSNSPQADYTTTDWQTSDVLPTSDVTDLSLTKYTAGAWDSTENGGFPGWTGIDVSESTTEPFHLTSWSPQDSTTERDNNTPYVEKDSSPLTVFEFFTTVESTTDIEATTKRDCCEDQDGLLNCITHREESCVGIYEPWAGAHCQAYCGMCKPCPFEPCVDTNEYCPQYGESACSDPNFRIWAFQNCMKFCNLCTNYSVITYVPDELPSTETFEVTSTEIPPMTTITPAGTTSRQPTCRNLVTHCHEYGRADCTRFKDFMTYYCPAYCGFCTSESGESGTTAFDPTAVTKIPLNCNDTLDNCKYYSQNYCCNGFEEWARENCSRHCGFCGIPPERECEDIGDNCEGNPEELCTQYLFRVNCAGFCKVCDEPWTPPFCAAYLYQETQETQEPRCYNKLSNCSRYQEFACCGIYEPWARDHCAEYCGFCGVIPPRLCHDTIPYCDREPEDLCTNDAWKFFREENCAGHCNVCGVPWSPPNCTAHLFPELQTITTMETTEMETSTTEMETSTTEMETSTTD